MQSFGKGQALLQRNQVEGAAERLRQVIAPGQIPIQPDHQPQEVGFSAATGLPLRDPRYEDEATYLGACLQIPRLGLRWLIKHNATDPEIAAHFGASEQMVIFRRNLTGQR